MKGFPSPVYKKFPDQAQAGLLIDYQYENDRNFPQYFQRSSRKSISQSRPRVRITHYKIMKKSRNLVEANENDTGNFYAVARGRVIGIFKDFETVKKNVRFYFEFLY